MKIKFPVGTTEENNRLLLEPGFLTFDIERKALRLHDGITQGGFEVVGEAVGLHNLTQWYSLETPFSNAVISLDYGLGLYVVGLHNGEIWISSDLQTWTSRLSSFGGQSVYALKFANGVFIAGGGGGGVMARSTNGTTWSVLTNPGFTGHVREIQYGNNTWVAVGNQSKLATSDNGVNWTMRDTPGEWSNSQVMALAYGAGTWVIGGQMGLYTTTDFITYTQHHVGTINPSSLVFINGRFLASSSNTKLTSLDGTVWTSVTIEGSGATSFTYIDDVYYAYNDRLASWRSVDLVDWEVNSPIIDNARGATGKSIINDGKFIVGGGLSSLVNYPKIWISDIR